VVVVCNLKPAKMAGFESAGMVLCAANDDHTKVFARALALALTYSYSPTLTYSLPIFSLLLFPTRLTRPLWQVELLEER